MPYVVGPNGLGLIRGANRLATLERLYGRASLHAGGVGCTATWRGLGLAVIFATPSCDGGAVLRRAVVTGRRWQTLSGTRVGDAVGAMRWRQRDAKALSSRDGTTTWLLASARRAPHPRLLAAATGGRVASLTVTAG
jgi:hypothetical protein